VSKFEESFGKAMAAAGRKPKGAPTSAQLRLLRAIVDEYDRQNADEMRTWKRPLAGFIDVWSAIQAAHLRRNTDTIWAIKKAGLISMETVTERHTQLRKGYYGRWIGGSEAYGEIGFKVKPTDAGRELLARLGV
jgi:hypothetical protein